MFNLIVGLFYFFGLGYIGKLIFKTLKIHTNNIIEIKLSIFPVGVLTVSYILQLLLYFNIYNNDVSYIMGVSVSAIGFLFICFLIYKNYKKIYLYILNNRYLWFVITFFIFSLLIALNPSTKIDELYYHMLLPSRIVLDQSILPYNYPWPSAILVHMFFQIGMTPLFEIGLPHASNIVSWSYSTLIAIIIYSKLAEVSSKKMSVIITLSIYIGLHPLVWHVTMGGHSYSEVSSLLLFLILINKKKYDIDDRQYLLIISLLSIALITSKLSYLPLSLLVIAYAMYNVKKIKLFKYTLFPYVVIFLPVLLFSYINYGSPFGPYFSKIFDNTSYDIVFLDSLMNMYSSKLPFLNLDMFTFFTSLLVQYSVFTILVIIIFLIKFIQIKEYRFIYFVFIFEILIVYIKLPHDIRFIGGLLYLIPLILLQHYYKSNNIFIHYLEKYKLALILHIIFYSLLSLYYSALFSKSLFLDKDWTSSYKRTIAYYDDYIAMDKLLPKDATIISILGRTSLSYMPRKVIVYTTEKDLQNLELGDDLYILSSKHLNGIYNNFEIGKEIYFNNNAISITFRTPYKNNLVGKIYIYKINKYKYNTR